MSRKKLSDVTPIERVDQRMKSIKEKAVEKLEQNKDEILCVYDRYAGFVDGANYVLDEIGKLINFHRWAAQDLYNLIDQLKK